MRRHEPVRLLVSVRTAGEAALALRGGADLIDLKEPHRGALGAVGPLCRHQVVRRVRALDPTRIISATVGDPPYPPDGRLARRIHAVARSGVDYVKVGIDPAGDGAQVLREIRGATARHPVVGVLLADRLHAADASAARDPSAWPRAVRNAGLCGLMLDTASKSKGSLLEQLGEDELRLFVRNVRNQGLLCGLAGSLTKDGLPRAVGLDPDYVGVRSAVCDGSRERALQLRRVRAACSAVRSR